MGVKFVVFCRLLEAEIEEKTEYIRRWVTSHMEDGEKELKKPVMFTEFGLSNKSKGFDPSHRDSFYKSIFDMIHESARRNGAGSGTLIWQYLVRGMEEYNDDFGIVPGERPSLDKVVREQSRCLAELNYGLDLGRRGAKDVF